MFPKHLKISNIVYDVNANLCATPECGEFKTHNDSVVGAHQGKFAAYADGGFYLDFNADETATKEKISQLKKSKWLDDDTRVVQIVFTVFNSWNQLYYNVRMVIEFPSGPANEPTVSAVVGRRLESTNL